MNTSDQSINHAGNGGDGTITLGKIRMARYEHQQSINHTGDGGGRAVTLGIKIMVR